MIHTGSAATVWRRRTVVVGMLERRILGNRSLGGPGRRFAANGRIEMSQTIESKNKALVLEAFDTLFNKRESAWLTRSKSLFRP